MGSSVAGRGRRGAKWLGLGLAAVLSTAGLAAVAGTGVASAASPPTLDLKVLLIGNGSSDPMTAAWASALTNEGVPYDEVDGTGTVGSEAVTLPTLSNGTTGNYNGVVIADDPFDFASGQLSSLYSYESTFGVRQVDGDAFPYPSLGQTFVNSGALDGTTGTLTAAGLTAFPELAGPIPFDAGTFGAWSTANSGAPYTPLITESFPATSNTPAGTYVLAGIYQHPSTDPQAGVSELALNFNYNANQLQWLLLAPGLINWVTQDTHLGLYRNYFGMDVDDVFIADNEWSSALQCTPASTNPPDYTCPPADQGIAEGTGAAPPDVQMSAADVDYVANWEAQTGIKLELAFNAIGACTAPTAADESTANCTNSVTDPSGTYTDPGQTVDSGYPNDGAFVDELLKDQADFNWITHTWSHQFLGCNVWQPQALTSVAPGTSGSLAAGAYSYEITAATAYGESEPSTAQSVTVTDGGSATLTWPEATNGTSTDGSIPGPTLAQLKSSFGGGTGFWGYNIYREDPGSSTYGLVAQVPEQASATSATTYSYTDTGATTPGEAPGSGPKFPSATDPGIDCAPNSATADSWEPATSTAADSSIDQEIGMDQAFAAANNLTNYNPAAVVTGEHSGLENPNMTAGLEGAAISVFAQDGSRQPTQYSLGTAQGAPRYPSNIYYNASNWPDELNEYNTLYAAPSVSIGTVNGVTEYGRCSDTSATTCRTTPATEADVLASESRIMLGHLLSNNPMINYGHQTDLVGPATQNGQDYGYTLLDLISNVQDQYDSWYNASNSPWDQVTDSTEAQAMDQQSAWATAEAGGKYTASETNGTVTVTNTGSDVKIPVTVPAGTTVNGAAFGQAYGGQLSDWVDLGTNATETLTENVAPTIISANSAPSIVGAAFSFTVTTTGAPAPALTETGALPAGITFTDNGNGTATIAGMAQSGTGGSYPITITANNGVGTAATQSFTLTNAGAPTITSANTVTFSTGVSHTYTVTTTGYPAPTITESGPLPSGLTFTDNGDGTATISGPAASGSEGSYPVSISATNTSGSTATLSLTITVKTAAAPIITSGSNGDFTLGQAGSVAITTTGSPTPTLTESGALPDGLSFTDNGDGTATLSGTPTATGTTNITIAASNGLSPDGTQTFSIVVGGPPAFTSANATTVTVGTNGTFTVTTTGYPLPSIGYSNVPPGLTFTDNGDGTATLSGTPTTAGPYAMDLTATNSHGSVHQTLTVTVQQAPAITSDNSAAFTVGAAGTFTVKTSGSPTAAITETGSLPGGVALTDNSDGTATLAGTPTAGTDGSYPITITASNGVSPDATQNFTLTINDAPAITSGNATTLTEGTAGSFSVTSTGYPAAKISESGALPSGITFADNGDGTATLAGTPAAGSQGSYPITITATNGVSPDAIQSFTLTVNAAPAFTSAASATSIVGAAFSFTVSATGKPATALSLSSGTLPSGLTFTDNGDGTATISGTPDVGTGGTYTLLITASNSVGGVTQSFTLTNAGAPTITSPNTATFTTGIAGTYAITTTGFPAPTITEMGTLPSGLTFKDNGDGTGSIAGTPDSTAAGTYPVSISATNSSGSTATLDLTITVNAGAAPGLTIPPADFTVNQSGSVTITTTGVPTPNITESGALPAGLTFTNVGDGTATITGTPSATGTTNITVTASNGAGPDATKPMTIVVGQAPAFSSGDTATATAGSAFSFNVATTGGYPTPTLTESGALPSGVTFQDNNDGTGTLSGTPAAGSAGTYTVTLTAANLYSTGVTQTFTLTVQQAPAITSANSATLTVGTNGTFTVTTTGSPTSAITESGALPSGVTFTDNGDGTATLAGSATAGTDGSYPITIKASNGVGSDATQSFTLTVNKAPLAPTITSGNAVTFTVGTQASFAVTSTGNPVASITESGPLPGGVTLVDNGDGTANLAGTPAPGSQGSYPITITASNGVSPDAPQSFTLTVVPANAAPVITSANGTTFAAGAAGTFSVTTTGYPVATVTESGPLPSGVTFKDNGDGTATLSGTPAAGSQGTYPVNITASNSVGTAPQSFVLTVNSGLAITSAASATATSGTAFSFTVTTTGTPTPTLSESGPLPSGLTFTNNGNGTATIAGTPASSAKGPYPLTLTARNSTGTASQAFTLTVANPPAFTSAATLTETAGTAFTFTVNTTAYPTAALSAGTLPAGVSFSDNGNGTGTLSGVTTLTVGTYPITITAKNAGGTATQAFTLTVNAAGTKVPVPTFTSPAAATATAGTAFTFTVTTVGSPTTYTTNLTRTGTLPGGISYTNHGNGTATLSGTPTAASGGTYPLTLTAKNSAGTVTQSFVVTVSAKPTITTAASATATVGSSFNFTVKANGAPAPTLAESGGLPQGLTWTDNGNGTATLAGTPGVGQGGVYHLTFSASNSFGAATQAFTLTVNQAPSITNASSATATHGKAFTFTFVATGYPLASITHTGSVRGLTYTNNRNGTATLSGTPTTAGTYTLTITATNSVGAAIQTFTLTVT